MQREPPVPSCPIIWRSQEISAHFECARGYALFIICFAVLQLAPNSGILRDLADSRHPPSFPAALLDVLHEPLHDISIYFCICYGTCRLVSCRHSSIPIFSSCDIKTQGRSQQSPFAPFPITIFIVSQSISLTCGWFVSSLQCNCL